MQAATCFKKLNMAPQYKYVPTGHADYNGAPDDLLSAADKEGCTDDVYFAACMSVALKEWSMSRV